MSSGRVCRLLFVAGARPNFMKVAPVMAAVDAWNEAAEPHDVRFIQDLVHTGQHYDPLLSEVFLDQLGLPGPQQHLGVGSASRRDQIELIIARLRPVLREARPDLVVVVGDVNSTVAAAQCSSSLGVAVAHVEAGLRSGDVNMPEEVNRRITDGLADLLFTTEAAAAENLIGEGVDPRKIVFVGNTMIDTLDLLLPRARQAGLPRRFGLAGRQYGVATLHRPSNVDDPIQLAGLVTALRGIAERLLIVWPVHPRTRSRLAGLQAHVAASSDVRLQLIEPLGYVDFLALMADARLVLTDSGGIQEETTVLGVPCLTLRTTTERPVTVTEGTNRLVDPYDAEAVVAAAGAVLARRMPTTGHRPELWDGHAAERIVAVIAEWAASNLRRSASQ